jgi:DNA-binding transcriptional ArsR family regulator
MKELPLRPKPDAGEEEPGDPLQPQLCAERLAALAAPERLKIVRFLRDGPRNVGEIAKMLETAPVNVSHHLSVLKAANIIRGKKQGRFILYSLIPGVLEVDKTLDHLNLGCCRLEIPAQSDHAGKKK